MFLIPLCFQNRPKNISTSALYWNEKIKYLQLHLGWKIFPEKMYFFSILASWMLIYEHDIHIYIYTCIDTYKYKLRGTHRGNGLILFLCCAFERLPLFFHHLLSTAQSSFKPAVSCVTPWRVHIRSHKFYVQGRHKRHPERSAFAFFSGTSFPGVIQV